LSSSVRLPEAFGFLWADKADDGLPVRYRAAYGGRGSAKSHSLCTAALLKGAADPLRIGVYREIQKSIRDSAKRLLDDKIAECGLSSFYESTDTEIRGKNGTLFLFNGLRTNPDAIKSTEGIDIALVMEANKVAQRSWDLLIPTVRKPGSEIWAEWNPNLPTDPVDAMFRGDAGPPPGTIVRQVNWNDNPWFPAVLKAELEYDRKRDPEKYAHVWLGEYQRNSEARVFRNWTVEEFEAPADAVHRFGADWGFAIDPTVLVRCHIVGRKLYVDYEAYMVGCEIDNTPALFDSIPESRRYLITADSARPETVSFMQRNGFPKIVPAIKGPGSVEDGIEWLKNFDVVVHPRCKHTIDELTLYSYKVDKLTGAVLPQLDDKSNHVIDALRYACEGARRAGAANPEPDVLPDCAIGEHAWML
jgi:phage terminase large subunit